MSFAGKFLIFVVLACAVALAASTALPTDNERTPNSPFTIFAQNVATKDGDEKAVVCPGGVYYCQNGQTCCSLGNGYYGCCKYSNAVCCTQPTGCCPAGYRCSGYYCV